MDATLYMYLGRLVLVGWLRSCKFSVGKIRDRGWSRVVPKESSIGRSLCEMNFVTSINNRAAHDNKSRGC